MPKPSEQNPVDQILTREKELETQLAALTDEAFHAETGAIIAKATAAGASADEIAAGESVERGDLARKYHSERSIAYATLSRHRQESWPTFRELFLLPALAKWEADIAQAQQDVSDLRKRWPSLDLEFNKDWAAQAVSQLESQIDSLSTSGHQSLGDFFTTFNK